jgi:hypothetical protein
MKTARFGETLVPIQATIEHPSQKTMIFITAAMRTPHHIICIGLCYKKLILQDYESTQFETQKLNHNQWLDYIRIWELTANSNFYM